MEFLYLIIWMACGLAGFAYSYHWRIDKRDIKLALSISLFGPLIWYQAYVIRKRYDKGIAEINKKFGIIK